MPTRGGDPLLWQHLFWIFGHPEVYIIFLPSIAHLRDDRADVRAPADLLGYPWIVLAAVGTGFLSFGLWVHHMFTTGLPSISPRLLLGRVRGRGDPDRRPDLRVHRDACWPGRVVRSTPMLFGAGALAIFVIGGLTGVMVALAPFDWQAHDTYFIVAHLHYVLIGGSVFPLVRRALLLLAARHAARSCPTGWAASRSG